MNKIIRLSVVLFLVCAITAGILGVVDYITRDRIAAQKQAKTERAYVSVLKSDGYEAMEFDPEDPAFSHVDSIARASGGEGYVVLSTFSGAQGMITMATGVDNDMACTGISVISHSETSGLGANAASAGEVGVNFRSQFIGQDDTIALSAGGGEIDALTGATITSSAITSAVAEAIRAVKALG